MGLPLRRPSTFLFSDQVTTATTACLASYVIFKLFDSFFQVVVRSSIELLKQTNFFLIELFLQQSDICLEFGGLSFNLNNLFQKRFLPSLEILLQRFSYMFQIRNDTSVPLAFKHLRLNCADPFNQRRQLHFNSFFEFLVVFVKIRYERC